MSNAQVREAIEKASKFLAEQPEKARINNPPAIANLTDGLKCHVTGPGGESLQTDMPVSVGGGATAPNPGWLMRAALAACNTTCIAMRAAKHGVAYRFFKADFAWCPPVALTPLAGANTTRLTRKTTCLTRKTTRLTRKTSPSAP